LRRQRLTAWAMSRGTNDISYHCHTGKHSSTRQPVSFLSSGTNKMWHIPLWGLIRYRKWRMCFVAYKENISAYVEKDNKTDNVRIRLTLRCVRATIVSLEKNQYYIFWVYVCSPRYPACKAHAPYCHVACRLYNIFPHYHINGTILEEKSYWI